MSLLAHNDHIRHGGQYTKVAQRKVRSDVGKLRRELRPGDAEWKSNHQGLIRVTSDEMGKKGAMQKGDDAVGGGDGAEAMDVDEEDADVEQEEEDEENEEDAESAVSELGDALADEQ